MNKMMMDKPMTMPMPPAMGMGMPVAGAQPMTMMMMPRCAMKLEKMDGGMRMTCMCEDEMARSMMQNMAMMMAGNMMSCNMMMNGMTMMTCTMAMGMCKAEMTEKGMSMTWTSGDAAVMKMIQACCDCMTAMMACGCVCVACMNNTPFCCGQMG